MQFEEWNPAVGTDCLGIWAETYYCIAAPAKPTPTVTSGPTSAGSTIPSPTQSGLISSCKSFYKAVKGDTCDKIVKRYESFTLAQFIAWNPAVGEDCSGLWAETYYCKSSCAICSESTEQFRCRNRWNSYHRWVETDNNN